MSIKIKNIEACCQCGNKDCSYIDAKLKTNFYGLRTEETVCPTQILVDGPLEKAKADILDEKNCINCGLCELSCHCSNLCCIDIDFTSNSFENLTKQQSNAIACSYLNYIFDFAANTNRNSALQFDGYVCTINGNEAFIQIDQDNDSLECLRRIIGDFLLYSPIDRKIQIGVIVLLELPREGSRDVYNVLKALEEFPTTSNYKFYFTTFNLLRLMALNLKDFNYDFEDLLLDLSVKGAKDKLFTKLNSLIPNMDNVIRCLLNIDK